MKIVKRYDVDLNKWIIGYYVSNTTFKIVGIVD